MISHALVTQTMTRRKADPSVKLAQKVTIHLSQHYYEKLERWLSHSNCRTVSELAPPSSYREQINGYHKDASLESITCGSHKRQVNGRCRLRPRKIYHPGCKTPLIKCFERNGGTNLSLAIRNKTIVNAWVVD